MTESEGKTRRGKTREVHRLLRGLISPALRKQGFARADIVMRWPQIVGPMLADGCVPEKLRFPRGETTGGVLFVRANSATALELQHTAPQIIDRINTYYGFRAVESLKITQDPVPRRRQARFRPRALEPEEEGALEKQVAGAEDEALRGALFRLGRAVLGRHSAPKRPSQKDNSGIKD